MTDLLPAIAAAAPTPPAGPTLHYFCLVSTDELNARYGVDLPTGAATNKVWGVARAVVSAGVRAVVVTGLIPVSPASMRSENLDIAGVSVTRVFATGSRLVRRLTAMCSFGHYALRHIGRDDRVLFYNYFWDYLLAAVVLRLAGRPAILDVEDGPRADEPGLRGFATRLAYRVFRRLCREQVVTVSHALASDLNLHGAVAVYGVVPGQAEPPARPRLAATPINVLYGGTINADTGLDLFVGAVELLRAEAPDSFAFHVTGHLDDAAAGRLIAANVTVHRALSQQHYRDLVATADIGLSLKLSGNTMGRTTFPSKVVEIASSGLLLMATRVSDIPLLFSESKAVLLDQDTPRALADALLGVASDLPAARAIAAKGQAFAQNEFSQRAVGERLRAFIFEHAA
jgi:glycosyltransferase involved in cell wall biosynthesis